MEQDIQNEVKRLLLCLANAVGVSGVEDPAAAAARELLEPLGACEDTALGSVICRVRQGAPEEPHLMLCAHLDQIGLIVTRIDEKGFLHISNCGGVDRATLWAAQVTVHTKTGPLPGVVCTIPPHVGPKDEKPLKFEDTAIDIGYDAQAAGKLVSPGDRVTLTSPCTVLPDGIVCGGVTDDRAGCAAVIAGAALAAEKLSRGSLTVLLSAQEETGSAGARTAAHLLQPTRAIAVDVSFAHTPDAPREKCGLMGKGPMIGIAPILDRHMSRRFQQLAQEKGIPYQLEVMGANTGTDADAIAISHSGVPTGLVSIPQKYMHTPTEFVTVSDVADTARLLCAYALDYLEGGEGIV